MLDTKEMFEDNACGRMKNVIFMQEGRTRLIYLAADKCMQSRSKIDGDILLRVLMIAFGSDFFPVNTKNARYEFLLRYVGELMEAGIFNREGKCGTILSFAGCENETAKLRIEQIVAVEKYLSASALDDWLKHVERIYSEGETHEAMHGKKASTLN